MEIYAKKSGANFLDYKARVKGKLGVGSISDLAEVELDKLIESHRAALQHWDDPEFSKTHNQELTHA